MKLTNKLQKISKEIVLNQQLFSIFKTIVNIYSFIYSLFMISCCVSKQNSNMQLYIKQLYIILESNSLYQNKTE